MARFLSPEWFALAITPARKSSEGGMVIEQFVRGTPDGDVRYRVIVSGESARIELPADDAPEADITITTSWPTACAIAQGTISTQRALMEGLLRFGGRVTTLSAELSGLGGLDPLPPGVRDSTTY